MAGSDKGQVVGSPDALRGHAGDLQAAATAAGRAYPSVGDLPTDAYGTRVTPGLASAMKAVREVIGRVLAQSQDRLGVSAGLVRAFATDQDAWVSQAVTSTDAVVKG
jgi:hypothetical protein